MDQSSYFYNKKVIITGTFRINRDDMHNLLTSKGAKLVVSVTTATEIIIIGDSPGPSKIEKLHYLKKGGINIEVLYEDDFWEKID